MTQGSWSATRSRANDDAVMSVVDGLDSRRRCASFGWFQMNERQLLGFSWKVISFQPMGKAEGGGLLEQLQQSTKKGGGVTKYPSEAARCINPPPHRRPRLISNQQWWRRVSVKQHQQWITRRLEYPGPFLRNSTTGKLPLRPSFIS